MECRVFHREEPYSIAMLCKEKRIKLIDKILATDIDQEVLNRAQQGIYPAKAAQGDPPAYLIAIIPRTGTTIGPMTKYAA
jgi:chemotaxis methyl-accepting protein methylase